MELPGLVEASADYEAGGLVTQELASRLPIAEPDAAGDVWYAVKAAVTNALEGPLSANVELQASDSDGFALANVIFCAVFRPGETKTLAVKGYMKSALYDEIDDWVVTGAGA